MTAGMGPLFLLKGTKGLCQVPWKGCMSLGAHNPSTVAHWVSARRGQEPEEKQEGIRRGSYCWEDKPNHCPVSAWSQQLSSN